MTTTTADYLRTAAHAAIERQTQDFLARGGTIETIPRGAMTEAGWSPAERLNRASAEITHRARAEHAERVARRKAEKATPLAPTCRPPVKRFAAPGTHKAQILQLLADGPATANELAQAIGATRNTIAVALSGLKRRGLVRSEGRAPAMHYHLA